MSQVEAHGFPAKVGNQGWSSSIALHLGPSCALTLQPEPYPDNIIRINLWIFFWPYMFLHILRRRLLACVGRMSKASSPEQTLGPRISRALVKELSLSYRHQEARLFAAICSPYSRKYTHTCDCENHTNRCNTLWSPYTPRVGM